MTTAAIPQGEGSRLGLSLSVGFHALVVVAATVVLPSLQRPQMDMGQVISVDLLQVDGAPLVAASAADLTPEAVDKAETVETAEPPPPDTAKPAEAAVPQMRDAAAPDTAKADAASDAAPQPPDRSVPPPAPEQATAAPPVDRATPPPAAQQKAAPQPQQIARLVEPPPIRTPPATTPRVAIPQTQARPDPQTKAATEALTIPLAPPADTAAARQAPPKVPDTARNTPTPTAATAAPKAETGEIVVPDAPDASRESTVVTAKEAARAVEQPAEDAIAAQIKSADAAAPAQVATPTQVAASTQVAALSPKADPVPPPAALPALPESVAVEEQPVDIAPVPRSKPTPPERPVQVATAAPEPPPQQQAKPAKKADDFLSRMTGAVADAKPVQRTSQVASNAGARRLGPRDTRLEGQILRYMESKCWNRPRGMPADANIRVRLVFDLDTNGKVVGRPDVSGGDGSTYWNAARDAAVRAVGKCANQNWGGLLTRDKYDVWQQFDIEFAPRR